MRTILFCTFFFVINCASAQTIEAITDSPPKPNFGDDVVKPELAIKAETVARQWFAALIQNNTKKILPLTGFPFAWDRVEIIPNKDAFINKMQRGTNSSNKENIPSKETMELLKSLTVKTITSRRIIIDKLIPIDVYIIGFSFEEKGKKHGGRITVQMSPQILVIGFSD